jgi:SnoaL-like protein
MADHPFIEVFRDAWRTPSIDTLMAPLRDDVRLIQPLSKPLESKTQARRAFRQILFRFPGLKGEVHGGLGDGDTVLIDWTLIVPVGRREIQVPTIDKVKLCDGQVKERIAYFDPLPLIGPISRRPTMLSRFLISSFFI